MKEKLKEYIIMLLMENDGMLGELNASGLAMLIELKDKYKFTTKAEVFDIVNGLFDKADLTELFQRLYTEYTDEESPKLFIKRIAKEYGVEV